MENQNDKTSSRRKFLFLGFSVLAVFSAFKFSRSRKKKTETVKMLTQDGRLVEIDKDLVRSSGHKIKDEDIHSWVNNKSSKTSGGSPSDKNN